MAEQLHGLLCSWQFHPLGPGKYPHAAQLQSAEAKPRLSDVQATDPTIQGLPPPA
jgi:hypothetical protein